MPRRPMMVPSKSELLNAIERAVDLLLEDADKAVVVELLRALLRRAGR